MLLYVTKGTEWCCVIVCYKGDRVVLCYCVLQRGQSGVVWFEESTLCRYDVRKGDLFVLGCARVRCCALVSVASVMFIVGAAVCSSLLLFLLLR